MTTAVLVGTRIIQADARGREAISDLLGCGEQMLLAPDGACSGESCPAPVKRLVPLSTSFRDGHSQMGDDLRISSVLHAV